MAKIMSKSKPPWLSKDNGDTKSSQGAKSSKGLKGSDSPKASKDTKSSSRVKSEGGVKPQGTKPHGSKPQGERKFSDSPDFNSPVKNITDQQMLEMFLEDVFEEPTDYGAEKIQALKKAGIESDQPGVLITMEDGTAYQIQIKKVKV
ncbi:hypothetical protein [Acidaminobacter hydrogenoformans]|uniref:Uncharacterized protein n=1 Tax=Acidaminobacter hydrogenoformans DSM 2784 TaxID=1120920 RepID=A0A1G5S0D1_9FIRM|nr:hypothetical protein [Acidaminobacter hydrogenoformans]SCZ79716.1 hypothetical protein SAMN03080599_01914 [Acidaminobacter hydrogenoformans DSM 2784]